MGGGRRPLHALLVDAHAVSGRGLLTTTALSVEALGRVVPGLDPRIDIGHSVTALGVRGRGLLTATAPAVSVHGVGVDQEKGYYVLDQPQGRLLPYAITAHHPVWQNVQVQGISALAFLQHPRSSSLPDWAHRGGV